MTKKLISVPLKNRLSPQHYTMLHGYDVLSDPGLAQLRRYLPVLAVVAAPYAGLDSEQDPLNPLDRAYEWTALNNMVAAVTDLQPAASARLALVRLYPPTAERLGVALAAGSGGPDAFRVVHLVCHGERDMLYLEDENGHEAYAVTEHVVSLFKQSSVQLVVMEGCFSQHMAQLLIDETSVEVVTGTRRKVSKENAISFATHFYAQLTGGASVQAAFQAAQAVLKRLPGRQADRYELLARDDRYEITLSLPEQHDRAIYPLFAGATSPIINVPYTSGFVGRRDALTMLAEDIPASKLGLYVLHGPAGIGKSWLAAEFAARFGWRFADGVLWVCCNAMTTTREVVAQVAHLLELPIYTSEEDVLAALRSRCILLVLDGVDKLASWAELERLGAWICDIDPASDTWVLITAHHVSELLLREGEGRSHTLRPFSYKSARTLAMRLAVEREIDALDVDTIDDFLEYTLSFPWLITQGVTLIEAEGLDVALHELKQIQPDEADSQDAYLKQCLYRIAMNNKRVLNLLFRAQGLPDAFDKRLARGLIGDKAVLSHTRILLKQGLLWPEGPLYVIPLTVRELVAERWPLSPEQQDRVDETIMNYLARTWPEKTMEKTALLGPELRSRLNNVRYLIQRQLYPGLTLDLEAMTQVLVAAAPTFQAAGLAEEFLAYAHGFREKLPGGVTLARLQMAMGDVLSSLPDQLIHAGWLYQVTLTLGDLDVITQAEAHRAYGKYLARVNQMKEANQHLSAALKVLLSGTGETNVMVASSLAQEWAEVLAYQGRYPEAARRFEAALTGYAEAQQAVLSANTQRDLSTVLLQLGEIDRAEDSLRRALATTDAAGQRDMAGQLRQRLAHVHIQRADHERETAQHQAETTELLKAEVYLNDALVRELMHGDSAALAACYYALGRVQVRLEQLDDAVSNISRSRALYEKIGRRLDLASVSVLLGQLRMAQGDSEIAQKMLHEALDLALELGDQVLIEQAAGVLVRVHQIRARHAPQADHQFVQNALDQARFTWARVTELGLDEHAVALDSVIKSLSSN